jgi:hypothetical protein
MHMRVRDFSPRAIGGVITYVYRVRSTETEGRADVNELGKQRAVRRNVILIDVNACRSSVVRRSRGGDVIGRGCT